MVSICPPSSSAVFSGNTSRLSAHLCPLRMSLPSVPSAIPGAGVITEGVGDVESWRPAGLLPPRFWRTARCTEMIRMQLRDFETLQR